MKFARKNYTLVEIAVVMTIIAVVLSLTLISVNKLSAAQSLNTAVQRLDNAARLARNMAVARQTNIALLLPNTDDFSKEGFGGEPCRSYRICEINEDALSGGAAVYSFNRWLPGCEWETIGDGVVIAGVKQISGTQQSDDNPHYSKYDPYSDTGKDYSDTEYEIEAVSGSGYETLKDGGNAVQGFFNDSSAGDDWDYLKIKDVPTKRVTNGGSGSLNPEDCVGIIFNKYGYVVNAPNVNLVLAEGFVQEPATSSRAPRFKFNRSYYDSSKRYLANWAEMRFEIFSGQPKVRFQGSGWGVDE